MNMQVDPNGEWKPERFVKRAVRLARLGNGLPLAVNRGKSPRVQQAPGFAIVYLEDVLSEIGLVDELRAAAGPRTFADEPIQLYRFPARSAGVQIIDAQRPAEIERRLQRRLVRRSALREGGSTECEGG